MTTIYKKIHYTKHFPVFDKLGILPIYICFIDDNQERFWKLKHGIRFQEKITNLLAGQGAII